jgi:hypothetical protein
MTQKLIPNNVSRCNNNSCKKRMICKRYLQMLNDAGTREESITSSIRFEDKNCQKFIEHDDNN